ncbi:MAG: class GN sortase, partial [Acidobacteria bacterium]|nr:class GN sortase [Acidobacteriota bacterium]
MSRWSAARRRTPPRTGNRPPRRWLRRAAPLFLLATGALCLWQGGWIYAKAILAQVLIGRSWAQAEGGPASPPWPWADTYPVARLSAPRLGRSTFVLAGSSGRTLAFGPGHVAGTALPGETGNAVVGGHRDTHFSFLRDLRAGDELMVERVPGESSVYRVEDVRVVDYRDTTSLAPAGDRWLTLVTCYPF